LYLAKSDPRANEGFINKYRNDYYAEVVVLEDAEYLQLLASQIGVSYDYSADEKAGTNVSQTKAALVDPSTVLHPPTLLYWDYKNDPNATEFITNNGKNQVNVKVTFDSSDITIDGVEYEYFISTSKTGVATGSTASDRFKPVDPTTVHFSHYYNGMIEATWSGITDAVGYTIVLEGANAKTRAESQVASIGNTYTTTKKRNYYLNYNPNSPSSSFPSPGYLELDSNGKATIKILPTTGHLFTGSYTIYFVAHYTDGAADIKKSPKATFTIGGGAPVIV
jgi:hypothetical protein